MQRYPQNCPSQQHTSRVDTSFFPQRASKYHVTLLIYQARGVVNGIRLFPIFMRVCQCDPCRILRSAREKKREREREREREKEKEKESHRDGSTFCKFPLLVQISRRDAERLADDPGSSGDRVWTRRSALPKGILSTRVRAVIDRTNLSTAVLPNLCYIHIPHSVDRVPSCSIFSFISTIGSELR